MGRQTKNRKSHSQTNIEVEPVPSTSSQSDFVASHNRSRSAKKSNKKATSTSFANTDSQPEKQHTTTNFDENVNNCVRYLILRAGADMPIRKSELIKILIAGTARSYEAIIKKVTNVLLDGYGFELKLCNQTAANKNKIYYLCAAIPYKKDPTKTNANESSQQHDRILLLFILSHIFMSNGPVTENSLYSFLKSIKIDPEENHAVFGNVKNLITTFKKKMYINIESSPDKMMYDWGPKAEAVVSKEELLKFICKIYGNRAPQSWPVQFATASKQFIVHDEDSPDSEPDNDSSDDDF